MIHEDELMPQLATGSPVQDGCVKSINHQEWTVLETIVSILDFYL